MVTRETLKKYLTLTMMDAVRGDHKKKVEATAIMENPSPPKIPVTLVMNRHPNKEVPIMRDLDIQRKMDLGKERHQVTTIVEEEEMGGIMNQENSGPRIIGEMIIGVGATQTETEKIEISLAILEGIEGDVHL